MGVMVKVNHPELKDGFSILQADKQVKWNNSSFNVDGILSLPSHECKQLIFVLYYSSIEYCHLILSM